MVLNILRKNPLIRRISSSVMTRYDIVVYGATGFTGQHIVENIVTSKLFEDVTFAVAGRSEQKLRKVLSDVSDKTGKNIRSTAIIVADSSDESTLGAMACQAKVVINAVGPYRLYGEAVVRACVENGASHVDISGEPAYIEKMVMLYGEKAKEKNIFIVGACGWDSIPCDLGIHFLKRNFGGDLNHAETFVQMNSDEHEGYSFNAGTYQTLILGISEASKDGLGKIRRSIMPTKIVRGTTKPPKRGALWQIDEPSIGGWALPFPGADRSIVSRSQYYDSTVRGDKPAYVECYIRVSSLFWALMLALWVTVFSYLVQFSATRKILQAYPDQCSFYMFKNSGPTKKQMEKASFVYWLVGTGYSTKKALDEQHEEKCDRRVVATCKGPDAGYIATSGCVLSSALAVLKDREHMPKEGGAYTTAAAFGDTKIYDYLKSFGITYQIEEQSKL